MGEESFHSGVCSGSWWSALRSGGGLDSPPLSAAAAASCSAAAAASDVGSFGWALEVMESKARSSESAASGSAGSTLTFQGIPAGTLAADSAASAGFLMEPTAAAAGSGLASPSMNWSQALIRSSRRSTGEGFYDLLNNDDLGSRSSSYMYHQEPDLESNQAGKDINQEYMIPQPDLYSGGVAASSSFHGVLFPGSSALLQDLLDQDMKRHASAFSTCSTNFMSPAGFRTSSSSGECSAAHHQSLEMKQDQQYSGDHLQFSNDSPLWSTHATAGDSARTAGFCSSMSMQTQLFTQQPGFERKPSRTSVTGKKPNSDGSGGDQSSPAMGKKAGEPALKKARIETPSPLPTFKVRKEKLGDRITALQQLVSPFGKTDTASVLHEAIEYIKLLHEQVGVLSTPYLKNGPPMQHLQASDKYKDGDAKQQDLRSRGLCLVPISVTFPVVNEPTAADLWTPTFGGSYR